MPTLDSNSQPPAIIALIKVRNPATGAFVDQVPMIVDTGADATVLPKKACDTVGATTNGSVTVSGFDGSHQTIETLDTEIIFEGFVYRGAYLALDQDTGFLGRDVILEGTLVVDGPSLTWEFSHP